MAGRQGLEPRYADPESAVLPLDDLPAEDLLRVYHAFLIPLAEQPWHSKREEPRNFQAAMEAKVFRSF